MSSLEMLNFMQDVLENVKTRRISLENLTVTSGHSHKPSQPSQAHVEPTHFPPSESENSQPGFTSSRTCEHMNTVYVIIKLVGRFITSVPCDSSDQTCMHLFAHLKCR